MTMFVSSHSHAAVDLTAMPWKTVGAALVQCHRRDGFLRSEVSARLPRDEHQNQGGKDGFKVLFFLV